RVPRRERLRAGLRGLSLMNEQQGMENPPHPGDFIAEIYLEPFKISGRELAQQLDVAASTLSRVLNGSGRVTPEMALRLSKVLGRSAESWLAMQRARPVGRPSDARPGARAPAGAERCRVA